MESKEKAGKYSLTIFKAEIAEKYGAPVYSRHPPITAIFPDGEQVGAKEYQWTDKCRTRLEFG